VTTIPEKVPFSERRVLRVPEARAYASIGNTQLHELIRSGKIESMKLGTRRLIFRESLDRLISPKPAP
jgi:excisionase family DNA binding protein